MSTHLSHQSQSASTSLLYCIKLGLLQYIIHSPILFGAINFPYNDLDETDAFLEAVNNNVLPDNHDINLVLSSTLPSNSNDHNSPLKAADPDNYICNDALSINLPTSYFNTESFNDAPSNWTPTKQIAIFFHTSFDCLQSS